MTQGRPDWRDPEALLYASKRKLEIAKFHRGKFDECSSPRDARTLSLIEVQAFFEGAIQASVSCVLKATDAVGYKINTMPPDNQISFTPKQYAEIRKKLNKECYALRFNNIHHKERWKELKDLRNDIEHNYTIKNSTGSEWTIYFSSGLRDIVKAASEAIEYAENFYNFVKSHWTSFR